MDDLANQIVTAASPPPLRYATIRARGRDPGTEGQDERHPFHVHGVGTPGKVGHRDPFDAIEDAINYLHRNGYARLEEVEEKRWRNHMNGEERNTDPDGTTRSSTSSGTAMPNLVIAVFSTEQIASSLGFGLSTAVAGVMGTNLRSSSLEAGADEGSETAGPADEGGSTSALTATNLAAAVINTAASRAERLHRLPQIATVNRGPGPDEWRFEYFVRGLVTNQIRGFKYIEDAINLLVSEAGYRRLDVAEEERWRTFIDYANYNGEPDDPFVKFAGNVPSVFAK